MLEQNIKNIQATEIAEHYFYFKYKGIKEYSAAVLQNYAIIRTIPAQKRICLIKLSDSKVKEFETARDDRWLKLRAANK